MGSTKMKSAVMWDQEGQLGITLHLPVVMVCMKEGGSKGGFTKIKDVDLPEPMTSNQFNTFITSKAGHNWAKKIVEDHNQKESTKESLKMGNK
jgi:hypothetical protein